MATIGDLEYHIHYLIIQFLHASSPSSLYTIRLVSKSWNDLAESFIYKSITLRNTSEIYPVLRPNTSILSEHPTSSLKTIGPWEQSQHFAKRLLDPADHMRSLVRELIVRDHLPTLRTPDLKINHKSLVDELLFDASALEPILENLTHLRYFSWISSFHIPTNVLSKFHSCWPEARLCIINPLRAGKDGSHMDLAALSSPQLHRLQYSVFSDSDECTTFRNVILRNPSLRVFHLDSLYKQYYPQDRPKKNTEVTDPELTIEEQENFAPIQLKMTGWDKDHINTLYYSLLNHPLTTLRTLHLGPPCPAATLKHLTNLVPNLTSLSFWYTRPQSHVPDHQAIFLSSISALEELWIWQADTNEYMWDKWFLPLEEPLRKHEASLQTLGFSWAQAMNISDGWSGLNPGYRSAAYVSFLTSFKNVKKLSIELHCGFEGSVEKSAIVWPAEAFSVLSHATHLHFLTIRFRFIMLELINLPLPSAASRAAEWDPLSATTALFHSCLSSTTIKLDTDEAKPTSARNLQKVELHLLENSVGSQQMYDEWEYKSVQVMVERGNANSDSEIPELETRTVLNEDLRPVAEWYYGPF